MIFLFKCQVDLRRIKNQIFIGMLLIEISRHCSLKTEGKNNWRVRRSSVMCREKLIQMEVSDRADVQQFYVLNQDIIVSTFWWRYSHNTLQKESFCYATRHMERIDNLVLQTMAPIFIKKKFTWENSCPIVAVF